MKRNMKRALSLLLALLLVMSATAALAEDKRETVFAMADATGSVTKVIVSEKLYNPDKEDTLADLSTLGDIASLSGHAFEAGENGALVWQANGDDVSYQGTSTEPLPVALSIRYALDGAEIAPADLAGRSGHLTMTIDYETMLTESVLVNGEAVDMPVPFLAATVLTLDDDVYSNVQITNGELIDAGRVKAAVCVGLPGLDDALNLSGYDELNIDIDIPTGAVIEADVTNYTSAGAYTIVTNAIRANEDGKTALDIDMTGLSADLKDAMAQLLDGADQLAEGTDALLDGANQLAEGTGALLDGANQLAEGTGALLDGANQLAEGTGALLDGANTLSDGAAQLSGGLTAIDENSAALAEGAGQIFAAIIETANDTLSQSADAFAAMGIELNPLTAENYSDEIDRVEAAVMEIVKARVAEQADAALAEKVTEAVRAQVEEKVLAAAREQVEAQVIEGVKAQLAQTLGDAGVQEKDIERGVENQLATDDVKALIAANVDAAMQGDEAKAQAGAAVEEQMASDAVKALIEENIEAQKQADEYLAAVNAAVEENGVNSEAYQALETLRAKLDSVNAFCEGVTAYTAAVGQAAQGALNLSDGASQLASGAGDLNDGTAKLAGGASDLNDGAAELAGGANDLNDGAAKLAAGASDLNDGMIALRDGLNAFNEQAVEKLTSYLDGDLQALYDRAKAMLELTRDDGSYAGLADGMTGATLFIVKSEGI